MNKTNDAENIAKGVLSYLKRNGREYLLEGIIERLQSQLPYYEKAVVLTARELSEAEKYKAKELASKFIKKKEFEVSYEVDESILDGMKIIWGDESWDISLASQIRGLYEKV
jgi:F0F1-type ATP synthase delta subunit